MPRFKFPEDRKNQKIWLSAPPCSSRLYYEPTRREGLHILYGIAPKNSASRAKIHVNIDRISLEMHSKGWRYVVAHHLKLVRAYVKKYYS